MELYLARHGEADATEPKRYLGATDVPLTTAGMAQACRLAVRLEQTGLTRIVSSPLLRARATAQAVAERTGLIVTVEPALREIDFGRYEGLTYREIEQHFPDPWQAMRDPGVSFPQGECANDVARRVAGFAGDLRAYAETEKVLVVAHGGSLRVLTCGLLGIPLALWWKLAWGNAGLSLLDYHPDNCTLRWHNLGH
ncbi:MAG TPA: histidine phosphatase family protein [bacterium]|nr:histidine phosphatase family protein [bacterium]